MPASLETITHIAIKPPTFVRGVYDCCWRTREKCRIYAGVATRFLPMLYAYINITSKESKVIILKTCFTIYYYGIKNAINDS